MEEKSVYLSVKDYSVSGEDFQLVYNAEYDMLETLPQPKPEKLPEYYKSKDYISHTDAKRNWFEKAYHLVRNFSLKRKLKLINSFSSEDRVLLDIGCGTGDFLQTAQENNWTVYGIEPNETARNIANKKTGHLVFDSEELSAFEDSRFDVITLWHVLEHLPDLQYQTEQLKRLLKPNGTLVIAVPNFKSYDAQHYKQFWAGYDVPRHLWHFSKEAIQKLFSKKGMQLTKAKPMWFDAFYVSMLSEKHKTGKMNIVKSTCIGMLSNLKSLFSKECSSHIYVLKNN